jgi:hypothetical protein
VFVGSRLADKVHYITKKDGNREAKVLLSGLYRPNGLARAQSFQERVEQRFAVQLEMSALGQ